MKRRICVRSMMLGAVIMLIGLAVGAIVSPPLGAQRNGVFDEIQCTKLTVVDNMGKRAVELKGTAISNLVGVYDKQGEVAVTLDSSEYLGNRVIVNKVDNQRKTISVVVVLGSTEYGGQVDFYNNQGKKRAAMGVNEYGNGGVSTWDKNGYRQ